MVQSPYVAFLDADDLWFREKVAQALPHFDDSGVVAVGSAMKYVSANGRYFGYVGESPDGPAQDAIRQAKLMPFPISGTIFRTAAVRTAGGFDQSFVQAEDLDFFVRVARLGRIAWNKDALGAYRVHQASLTAKGHDQQLAATAYLQGREKARSEGVDFVDLATFIREYSPTPAQRRQAEVTAQYRAGAVGLASGHYLTGAGLVARAFLRNPRYVVRRTLQKSGLAAN